MLDSKLVQSRIIKFLLCSLILLLGEISKARFEYSTDVNGENIITTTSREGEGIAAILRQLGLDPNWQDQSWLRNIQRANSSSIDPNSFEIYNSGSPISFPASAVSMCSGYSGLLSRFSSGPVSQPVTYEQPVVTETYTNPIPEENLTTETVIESEMVTSPTTVPGPAKIKIVDQPPVVAVEEIVAPKKSPLDVDLHVGFGASSLFSTFNLIESNLNSDLNGFGSIKIGFPPSRLTRMTLFARGFFTNYRDPAVIALVQLNPTLFELGASFGFRVYKNTFFSALWGSQQKHFNQIFPAQLSLVNPWTHGAGLQLDGRIYNLGRMGFWYTLSGKYILSGQDTVALTDGLQATARLQFQPNLRERGVIVGAEYTYHDQDLVVALPSRSSQMIHSVLGFVGFRF